MSIYSKMYVLSMLSYGDVCKETDEIGYQCSDCKVRYEKLVKYCNECGSRVIGVKVLRWDEGFVRYLEGISISTKYMEDDWRGEGLLGNVGFHSKDIVSLIDPYYFDRGKLGNFYWGKEIMMINDDKDRNGRRIGMNELSIGEIEKEGELVREQIRRMGITDEEKWRVNVYMKILTGG